MAKKDTPHKTKLEYLKRFTRRIKQRDRTVPSLAQYTKMSGTEKGLAHAGIAHKKIKRLSRRKK